LKILWRIELEFVGKVIFS